MKTEIMRMINTLLEVIEVDGLFYIGTVNPLKIYSVNEFNTKDEATVALLNNQFNLIEDIKNGCT